MTMSHSSRLPLRVLLPLLGAAVVVAILGVVELPGLLRAGLSLAVVAGAGAALALTWARDARAWQAEAVRVGQAVAGGDLGARLELAGLTGAAAGAGEAVNGALDVLEDKVEWFRAIVDAVPFPIHVTDADMSWTFMNRAFEALMIREKRVVSREKAVGMACSNAAANICNTEGCGIRQHRRGVKESYFDWCGMSCKQDTAELVDRRGQKIGYVETVTDLTAITKLKNDAADRAAWYEAILDAVPFPIHVTDADMKWAFMNKAFEKLMVEGKRIQDRKSAVGMACSNAAANICNTDKCGIAQLRKGTPQSYFDWCGMSCKQDTAQLKDRHGKMIGYVETVTDLTSIIRARDYTSVEVERIAANLALLAKGDLRCDLAVAPADAHTKEVHQNFTRINANLGLVAGAVQALSTDATLLAGAAIEGKLSVRADTTKHQGVFREVVDGVNRALDAVIAPVREATRALEQLAHRDLRARVTGEFQGDHAVLKEAVNTSAKALHDALAQVSTAVEQLSSASAQIAASSQAVASGASEQAASLEETTSSLESVAGMTRQSADNAQQASTLAVTARTAATDGANAVEQLNQTMGKIRQSAEGTSQIIRDVSDIAFQTNLLALNAAVEAARAGEAGRGFAVVAEEVRSLALRAKEAATKTEELIRQSVKQAGEGELAATQVAGKLQEIVQSVGKVTDVVSEIAGAAKEQATGINQVNKAINEMDKVTQQNAASAEESSSTASELSGQAEQLASMVATFELERTTGPATRGRAATRRAALPPAGPRAAPSAPIPAATAAAVFPMDDDTELKNF
jgi:methyl-accepting chemotaxis protein